MKDEDEEPERSSVKSTKTWAEPPSQAAEGYLGRYHLLEKIGEGGMGEVWVAEQSSPVHRTVALKVIKLGMDTRQVIARFEAERQALALMDHPCIAKIFDAGETEQGRPYFVMEYVKGAPITEYCDQHRLSNRERIELFLPVCEAVQHAHQKGIIHRDLKPANILVALQDGKPVPKIVDFGVAKATAQPLTEKTLYTSLGQFIGTPEYMSPEQAELSSLDVDTRTDVYALGVVLYELLVGALPFESVQLRQTGLDEIRRIIREVEPQRPSTRFSTLGPRSTGAAERRRSDPTAIARQLRGDLDWIILKALEKDRTRRYGTALDFAADIERHLKHEPVTAGPPSAAYRAGKFIRRHRFGVAAAASLVLLLAVFAVAMGVQAQRIARERDRANREAARARDEAETATRVTEFMTGLFRVSDPSEARGNTITAREVLDKGVETIDTELASQPRVQSRLMLTMGNVYVNLGLLQEGEALLRRSVDLATQLGVLHDAEGLDALNGLGGVLSEEGKYAEAERCFREVLEARRGLLGADHPRTMGALGNLGVVLFRQGKYSEAEAVDRQVLSARERTLGPGHIDTVKALMNLGGTLLVQGKYGEAADVYRRSLDGLRRTVGADHPDTLGTLYNLGAMAELEERWAESEAYYTEALRGCERVLGADQSDTIVAMLGLARIQWTQGNRDEAEAMTREALTRCRRALPQEHPTTASSLVLLGEMLNEQGRFREARPYLEEDLEIQRALLPPEHWFIAEAECHLGDSLRGLLQYEAAEPLLVRGCSGVLATSEATKGEKRAAVEHVIALYEAWGKPEQAAEWRAKLEAQQLD